MQQTQKTRYEKCLITITGTCWVAGLLVAGSDSPYMPWLNGIGLILFLGAGILLGKLFRPSHSGAKTVLYPRCHEEKVFSTISPKKKNRKINTPCALGI